MVRVDITYLSLIIFMSVFASSMLSFILAMRGGDVKQVPGTWPLLALGMVLLFTTLPVSYLIYVSAHQ